MSKYNAYRRKLDISDNCIANYESSFITEGTSSVIIHNMRLNVNKQAAIIITDKEGPDTSLVYTFKERAKEQELLKGDYYTWQDKTYLVYEDISLVLSTNYKKQKSYQCNATVHYTCDCGAGSCFGYYVSSLARWVDTNLQGNLNITDNDKPILILPKFNWISIGAKVIIANKPYKIIEFDAITNDGIAYCSLDRDFIDKYEDVALIEPETATLIAGIKQSLDIKFGYFTANCKVDIISKTLDKVEFIIPYGIEQIEIITKDENKIDVVSTYKVVI